MAGLPSEEDKAGGQVVNRQKSRRYKGGTIGAEVGGSAVTAYANFHLLNTSSPPQSTSSASPDTLALVGAGRSCSDSGSDGDAQAAAAQQVGTAAVEFAAKSGAGNTGAVAHVAPRIPSAETRHEMHVAGAAGAGTLINATSQPPQSAAYVDILQRLQQVHAPFRYDLWHFLCIARALRSLFTSFLV